MTSASGILAICPGSFDPLTMGHVDIIERAARLYDRVVVAVLVNREKAPMFSLDERLAIIRETFTGHPNVEADTFEGLLVDYAMARGATVIVKGLRAVADFEYEYQMALMNRHLAPGVDTTFMMPAERYTYISSRLIKEVFALGGSIEGLVPPVVEARLRARRQQALIHPDARPT
ncbi:MAG: pantetheine-phosphate adenylyltransferase [Acidobacteria bacterium]|nr:pantetheine-phosphate adenylyltransferase [Acidobacteriota bacterium]